PPRRPRAGIPPAHHGPQRPGPSRALPRAGDARVAVQPRGQVRHGRGPDRPGPRRGRPRSHPLSAPGVDRPGRAGPAAMIGTPGQPEHPESWTTSPPSGSRIPTMSTAGQLLIETITHADSSIRDRSARDLVAGFGPAEKLRACAALEEFRRTRTNLYERVRASLFLHALYRYEIQDAAEVRGTGLIPFPGFRDLMERRYEQAIAAFLDTMRRDGPNGAICSALAQAYEHVAFQDLADQVRRSVRSCRGNRWMFRVGGVDEHPLRIHPQLLARESEDALFPILVERTPVPLDPSHSGWSHIFFL